MTMYAGYHPDAFWSEADIVKKSREKKEKAMNGVSNGAGSSTPLEKLDVPTLSTEDDSVDEEDIEGKKLFEGDNSASSSSPNALPQCVDSLDELRKMIEIQEAKIKELQERVQKKGDGGEAEKEVSSPVR